MKHIIRRKTNIQPNLKVLLCTAALILAQLISTQTVVLAQSLGSKKLNWGAKNITLKHAFEELEKLTGASISYNNSQLKVDRMVQVQKAERTLAEVINILLNGSSLTFRQAGDRNILIVPKGQADGKIKGKVTDAKGEPLPGATIKVLEINRTTSADYTGHFSLSVDPGTYTLEVTFISFNKTTISGIKVNAKEEVVRNIKLTESANSLQEVVVTTALGIKRDAKALGYAATVVNGEQLTEAVSNNWTDALSGKVAGLNLVRSNSGPTGSNKIILRGENNLTGDNEALIVVDGIVINNSSGRRTANGGELTYGTGSDMMPADYGSSLNDINPEDIESVTVLKGPGAAALYGQRGANGAVIITTKSGNPKKKGIGVTLNSNTSFEEINRWPDLQWEYGQGTGGMLHYSFGASEDGVGTSGTSSAYGPKFDGQLFYQYDPVTQTRQTVRTPWVPYKNKIREFFDTGKTFTNSVSVDGGTDKTTARFSATNVKNEWILPNTGYGRNSVALSVNSKVNDKLSISSKLNYQNKFSDNLPSAGYGNQSIMYWFIFWQPSADLDWLKNYWVNGQEQKRISYPYSTFPENPYAVSYEFINRSNRDAFTGNVQAAYNFSKKLSLQLRTSMDFGYEQRAQERPYDAGTKYPKGAYRTQNIFSQEVSADFLIRYTSKIGKDVSVSATGGGSILKNNYNRDEVRADSLFVPGTYSMANNAGPLVSMPYRSKYGINSFYGMLTASLKEYLFVDFTARQDWNSTLATPLRTINSGFFYPSANLSFIPSELFKLPAVINYAKFRASIASVGSGGTTPYLTSQVFESAGALYSGGIQNPTVLANPDLKPLNTTTLEIGSEMKFFKSRLGFDLALYTGTTKNQILYRQLDRASGYAQAIINAGSVKNQGLELALNGVPLKSKKGLTWSVNYILSANRNKIESLPDTSIVLKNGPVGGGQIVAKVGGSMGDLYGRGYLRDPEGRIVYDATTGNAQLSDEVLYLGNTIPKWKTSLSNDFRFKQFHLNVLFDAQIGGVSHSLSHYKLAEQGKTTNTLPGRYNGIIGNGVVRNTDGTYRSNDVIATNIDEYYRSHFGIDNAEGSIFSTDFLKFREARLDYTLSPAISKSLGLQRATIGVYGRNLYIWSKWPIFDPEFGTLDGSDIVQGFEIAQFPSTRTFGFNLVVGF